MAEKFCCRVCGHYDYVPVRLVTENQAGIGNMKIELKIGRENERVDTQDCLYACSRCSTIFHNPEPGTFSREIESYGAPPRTLPKSPCCNEPSEVDRVSHKVVWYKCPKCQRGFNFG